MSIASEITRIQGNISDAYTAANGKGATMPATQNSANLATTISSIQTGITPSGTKSITTNGTHDVAGYANADVQVPTTAPAHYVEKTVDANGVLKNSGTSFVDLSGVTSVEEGVLAYQYENTSFPANTQIDLSTIVSLTKDQSFSNTFKLTSGITSVDLSSLTTVSGNYALASAFDNSTDLASVNLSSLTTVSGNYALQRMLIGCGNLTNIVMNSLTTVSGVSALANMFTGSGITSADMSSLTSITGVNAFSNMFASCMSLATVYIGGTTAIDFGTRTNQFSNMFYNCTQNIDVYAPAANQTTIGSFSGYPNFGGTGTVTWHWRS